MLYYHHGNSIEVSLVQIANDKTTDFDVVFETTWTCIRLGAIRYRALDVVEPSCIRVMMLKMVNRSHIVESTSCHLHPYGILGR